MVTWQQYLYSLEEPHKCNFTALINITAFIHIFTVNGIQIIRFKYALWKVLVFWRHPGSITSSKTSLHSHSALSELNTRWDRQLIQKKKTKHEFHISNPSLVSLFWIYMQNIIKGTLEDSFSNSNLPFNNSEILNLT